MTENIVIIDDDDEEMLHIKEKHMEMAPANETIVLDEDSKSEDEVQTTNSDANTTKIVKTMSKKEKYFVDMLKSNNLMDKLVKLCLNMENAVGMPRVINKTLLPLYKDASQKFKTSSSFRKLLKRTLKRVQKDPDHKFLHVKTLCEVMKEGNIKKKVPFVTLATNLKHNHSAVDLDTPLTSVSNSFHIDNAHEVNININTFNEQTEGNNKFDKEIRTPRYTRSTAKTYYKKKRCKTTYGNIMSKKNKRANTTENAEVIDLDNSDTESSNSLHNPEIVSNNNEENADTRLVSNLHNEVSNNNEKENDTAVTSNNNKEEKSSEDKSPTLNNDVNSNNNIETNLEDRNETRAEKTDYDLLIPSSTLKVDVEKKDNKEKIWQLEQLIDSYNKKIIALEEAEVINDSILSPYIQCDKYKASLLDCYKQLSKLTGCSADIAKRREIRIKTGEGRLSGPAKLLEERLNKSIDRTGMVAFPDFCDVVECVQQYHAENKCGWNTREIFKQATTLFKRCGEALRRLRQKHEYKYLLGWVSNKEELEDPAEKDPQLLATLEENKLVAQAKEQEIVERYANMEDSMSPSFPSNTGLRPEFEEYQDSSDSESEDTRTLQNNIDSQGSKEITNQGPLGKVLVNVPNSLSNISHYVISLSDKSSPNLNLVTDNNKTNEAFSNVNNSNASITNILQDNSRTNFYRVMNNPSDWSPNKTVLQDHNPQNDISTFNMTGSLTSVLSDSNLPLNYVSNNSNDRFRIEEQNSEKVSWPGPIKIENIFSRIEFTNSDDKSLNTESGDNVNIKLEPVDIQSMLDDLGDGFVSTVIEIEDPFLVIDISSDDSSDGES